MLVGAVRRFWGKDEDVAGKEKSWEICVGPRRPPTEREIRARISLLLHP